MRLELHRVKISGLKFGDRTEVKNGILSICKDEMLAEVGGDTRFASIGVELASPGERTRIIPVKDVIEPRCKISGPGCVYPGVVGGVETVGSGATLVLDGAAVVTCGSILGFQEGIVDMSGTGAEYTPFSKTQNVVLVFEPSEGLEKYDYEEACRLCGIKAAEFIARAALSNVSVADSVEVFELPDLKGAMGAFPQLPKVAYLYMLQTQGLLHDTYVYGVDAKHILPTLIDPCEVMDGAIVSGNCVSACDKNSSYVHANNPVIRALFARHGVDINFVGCIITNECVTLANKQRSSSYAVKLASMLGLDGLVISEEGFGNPDADLIMNCRKAEAAGIKTVLITDEYAGNDGASQSLADSTPEATAVVTAGNANMTVVLPPMERIIGDVRTCDVIAGGFVGSLKEDGSIEVELQAITGATCELGFNRLGATMF